MRIIRLIALLVVLMTALPSVCQAALNLLTPKNGANVRETVRFAVDASGLPDGSYATYYVNGTFIVAAGVKTKLSGGREAFVWDWDTKEPLTLGLQTAPVRPVDGKYKVLVRTVTPAGQAKEEKEITVNLSNRVTSVAANKAITLKYKFSQNYRKRYEVRVGVSVVEIGGAPLTNQQEVQSVRYTCVSQIDDLQEAALAVFRYYPLSVRLYRFGRDSGDYQAFATGSLYDLVNDKGRVVASDMYSTVGVKVNPAFGVDVRTPLPYVAVKPGDKWSGEVQASLPGIGQYLKSDCRMQLGGLEWAGGRECAVLAGNFDSEVTLMLSDEGTGQTPTPITARARGALSDWFAFRAGDLIRRDLTADLIATLDSATMQKLMGGLGLSENGKQTGSAGADTPSNGPGDEEYNLAQKTASAYNNILSGGGSKSKTAATTTKVTLRLHVTAVLKG